MSGNLLFFANSFTSFFSFSFREMESDDDRVIGRVGCVERITTIVLRFTGYFYLSFIFGTYVSFKYFSFLREKPYFSLSLSLRSYLPKFPLFALLCPELYLSTCNAKRTCNARLARRFQDLVFFISTAGQKRKD